MPRKRWLASAAGGALMLAVVSAAAAGGPAAAGLRSSHPGALSTPVLPLNIHLAQVGASAPTDAFCRANFDTPCYSPQEIRHAYGVDNLLNKGDNGKGETIVILDSFGSPTITSDLTSFDAGFGLPDPPSFKILAPLGTVPFDPSANPDQVGWAAETTLDVEWAHAMAPDAAIDLLTSPVDETEGTQGLPEFDQLLNYALNHHLGQIISQSWGATENTLLDSAGQKVIRDFEATYARAAAMGVTVFASAGDNGTANVDVNGNIFPSPTVNFPASSPFVTAVGGTSLTADTSGNYQSETVWNSGDSATGGGISQQFAEPLYQRLLPSADQKLLNGNRGLPDVSWNADPNTSILVFFSALGPNETGYFMIGGTSEGGPQLAGLTADLNQSIGHPIGFLNPFLYVLGALHIGFHDVTTGNNGIDGVTGFNATPGWDASTGFGTPNVGHFITDLAALARGTAHGTPSLRTLRDRAASLHR